MIVFLKKDIFLHEIFFENHFRIIGVIFVFCLLTDLTKIRAGTIEALAVVGARERIGTNGFSCARGMDEHISPDIYSHMADTAGARCGEKDKISLFELILCDGQTAFILFFRGTWDIHAIELVDSHNQPAAIQRGRQRAASPLVGQTDEALGRIYDLIPDRAIT
jgi:hypothetical protein